MRPTSHVRAGGGASRTVLVHLALVAPLLLGACAPLHAYSPPALSPPTSPASAAASLGAADLEGRTDPSLYEAILELRGSWLHPHGPVSITRGRDIIVYLDGDRLGGPDALRTIPVFSVISARRLSPPEAQALFGLNHPQGAITVSTRP